MKNSSITQGSIRVFIASPGDVAEERNIASYIVTEINRIFGNPFGIQMEGVRWETHAWPDIGDDAQDVINEQIGEFDIFIGIMWKHFGTPTKRAESGTGEEFERAYQLFKKYQRPKIMFYFRETPFYPKTLNEISQFRKVTQFREKLEKIGVLYWNYKAPLEFERFLREHLIRQIMLNIEVEKKIEPPIKPEIQRKTQVVTTDVKGCSVFMAYSHEDREAIMNVYHSLKGAGYKPWLDMEELLPGQMLFDEVTNAISKADVKLIFFSSKSISKRGYVAKELKLIMDILVSPEESFLIPIRLDNVELPVELRHINWIDYFLPNGLERLLDVIKIACLTGRNKRNTNGNK